MLRSGTALAHRKKCAQDNSSAFSFRHEFLYMRVVNIKMNKIFGDVKP